jgi:AcrR family transcriptional regulator
LPTPSLPKHNPLAPPNLLMGEQLPPPPQQARSRAKREALLQAALALFGERGYEATAIEAIAQQAGVAVGGFYQHFASKRQLLLVLMDQLLHEAADVFQAAPTVQQGVRPAIVELVRQGLAVDWAFAGAYRAWREAALRDPALHALNIAIEQWTAHWLEQLLSGLLTLPGARADVDIAMLSTVLCHLFWRIAETPQHDPAQIERVVQSMTHLIAHALFADDALPPP